MTNRINILDDELLQRNRSLVGKTNETEVRKTNENNQSSYIKKYRKKDRVEGVENKALSNPKEREGYIIEQNIDEIQKTPDRTEIVSQNIESFQRTSAENQIVKTDENKQLDSTKKYERRLNIFGKAVSYSSSKDVDTINDISELENRISERVDELGIFLFNLLPSIGSSVFSGVSSAVASPDIYGLAASASLNIANKAFNMKYFKPRELIYYYAANFYSLIFFRGITIKYGTIGRIGNPLTAVSWDGRIFVPVSYPDYVTVANRWTRNPFVKVTQLDRKILESRKKADSLDDHYLTPGHKRLVKPQNAERGDHETEKARYIIDDNVLNVNFTRPGGNPNSSADKEKEKVENIVKEKTNEDKNALGYIYVIPVVADEFENDLPRFKIPFEFNPNISEGDLAANYESRSVLSRIGELYSFNNVGSLTVTLETKYLALSANGFDVRSDGQSWMNEFTMKKLQGIEMAYRSLVMPHYPDETDESQGYKYMKPPLIKVVIGDTENETAPYAALLSYFKNETVEGKINSNIGKNKLRTFIATGVTIEKNLEETPLYLNEEKKLTDTFGFDVSLNLTEVTPSYMDSFPDYKKYFNRFKAAGFSSYVYGNGD